MKHFAEDAQPAGGMAARESFVERMFRHWVRHQLTMAGYRIGHY